MAFTQAQIDALDVAIAAGALRVVLGHQVVGQVFGACAGAGQRGQRKTVGKGQRADLQGGEKHGNELQRE